jgi:hypothetical protein
LVSVAAESWTKEEVNPKSGILRPAPAVRCATAAILTYRQHHRTIDLDHLLKPYLGRSRHDLAHQGRVINAQHIV